jgi:hypothetical protein
MHGGRHDVRDHIAAMYYAPDWKDARRDDEAIGADDPEEPDAELIRARTVVGVQEEDLR